MNSNISFDLGILSIFNISTPSKNHLLDAQSNFLAFYNELLKLKQKAELEFNAKPEEAQVYDFEASKYDVQLPKRTTIFPRHKKIPILSKQKTRWEQFAASKGIQKKKRSRMVFDEAKGDWVPRWGARSIKKNQDKANWAIALKKHDKDDVDPFLKKGLDRELKNERENLKKLKNEERKKGFFGRFIIFFTMGNFFKRWTKKRSCG